MLSIAKCYGNMVSFYIQVSKIMHASDEDFMREAILEAKKAYAVGEVPVGCVIVSDGNIIARASNSVESNCDASMHAELVCMQRAAKKLGNWRLIGCTLYCTLEPCAMCAGAMILFRIERLVYGAPDLRHGAIEVLEKPHEIHQVSFSGGVLDHEARSMMQEFFRERRRNGRSSV